MKTIHEAQIYKVRDIEGGVEIEFTFDDCMATYEFRMLSTVDRQKLSKLEEYAGAKQRKIIGNSVRIILVDNEYLAAFGHPTEDKFVKAYDEFSEVLNDYPKSDDGREFQADLIY